LGAASLGGPNTSLMKNAQLGSVIVGRNTMNPSVPRLALTGRLKQEADHFLHWAGDESHMFFLHDQHQALCTCFRLLVIIL
jgi:hypothetical protein